MENKQKENTEDEVVKAIKPISAGSPYIITARQFHLESHQQTIHQQNKHD